MNRLAAILIGVALLEDPSRAAEGFEKAHAILQEHCFKCHSHAEKKSKGGLMLDARASLLEGGDSGPAISIDKPTESLLLKAISYSDPDLQMPPKNAKLSDAQIATLTAWVEAGAPWPESKGSEIAGAKLRKKGEFTEAERQWWAFQPVKKVVPPTVKSSAVIHNDVDRFITARLEAGGLQPAGEASRSALIRRVTLDLTGLPPTPSEVKEFLADTRSDAYERLVDRLLESPRYGERMARYWLDLVRYADGDGYRADDFRPNAWRYRDYVIASFNSDKPYTRFIQEQLAGDEMFPGDPDAIIATGYLRHGIYEWNARDVRGQWETILNDLTDTTGDVFFGLGLQCARCHDHKFDPIVQKDYFRLQAFFAPIQLEDRIAAREAETLAHAERMKVWEEKTATIRAELAALEKPYLDKAEKIAVNRFPEDIQNMIRKPIAERSPSEHQLATLSWRQVIYDWERLDRTFKAEDKDRILSLRRTLAAFEKDKPEPLPTAFAAKDVGAEAPPVFVPKKKGLGAIEPGILTLLDPAPMKAEALPNSTGRRTALAKWLTDPANPLTARVFVNRAWQQRFGRGLAGNSSDFGTLGEKPTHPELLDWLAAKFVEEGWSMKKLNRLLVTSAAYRRSSEHPNAEPGKLKDPENRLWWRWTPRRLEAEQIRDSMLAVSGQLDTKPGGVGVAPDIPRRTIYTRFMRNTRDPLADVFDAPLWFTSASSRDTTTTPVQSLLLANSAGLRAQGRAFASRLEAAAGSDPVAQVRLAYDLAFSRPATSTEVAAAIEFIQEQSALADTMRLQSGQAAFIPGKVPYRDGQAALIEPGGDQMMFRADGTSNLQLHNAFTIEAFVTPRSVAESGALRTVAAKWDGNNKGAGWTLGITGQQSRRKPLSVAVQLVGLRHDGSRGEHAVFSDLSVQMNKPYFVAAAVTAASDESPGRVFFALKDLSNDDEPVLTATIEHPIKGGWDNDLALTIGARSGANPQSFHGMVDDVRISSGALGVANMLYTIEGTSDSTLGYWKFEPKPDVFADASGRGHALARPAAKPVQALTPDQAALSDFCHALLNSSEFLYIE